MKLTASQQQGRRGYSLRGPSTLDSQENGTVKSTATIFWLVLHGLCCLISLVLGFRFSRLVFFLVFSHSSTTNLYPSSSFGTVTESIRSNLVAKTFDPNNTAGAADIGAGSRVVVGRHGILIRPWPHPNPEEVIRANQIIERVQKEQRIQYGVKNPRAIIAITPTYVRTFQTIHLTGVMHTLMNVPYDLVWIVVEAGGTTNETASLLAKSGLKTIHIGFGPIMPILWGDRHKLESRMRLHALRVVREKHLDGLVLFADDSNMHSMELFDEIQNVKWIGAISIGILAHSGEEEVEEEQLSVLHQEEKSVGFPIQGPSCNSSNNLVGWHTFDSAPYINKSAKYIGDRAIVLPRKMEWAGFVLNSRLVWKDVEIRPEWVKDLDMVGADGNNVESPLSLLNDATIVEPLGNCGRNVMVWWLRVEARADSKFPPGWVVDPPLEITVPAKRTPWPDTPPEVPGGDKSMMGGVGGVGGGDGVLHEEKTEKHVTKSRSPHKKRSKKKHAPKTTNDERSLVRHPREK